MDLLINRFSNGLLSLGLQTGDKVGLLINNSIESAVAIFSVPRAGLTYVALNTRHSAREHLHVLNDSETDTIIIGEEFLNVLEPVLSSVPSLKHVIVIGKSVTGKVTYEELLTGQPETPPSVEVDYNHDIERIQYTSGTTGRPKGVVWTFSTTYHVLTNVLMNMDKPIGPNDINLNVGPLTHAAGLMLMVYYSRGATNIILPAFEEEVLLRTIAQERVTSLLLVPTMLYRLLLFPGIESYDLTSINRIWYGTAPMSVDRLKDGLRIFGQVFRQNYGMTEIAQPITFLGPEDHVIDGTETQMKRLSSAGLPAMGVEVKIADDNGQEVQPGQKGEIMVRSNKLMKEYWKMPEQTAEAFENGWFHTGDMGTMDEGGYVYIVDRKSDMIISGGFNIYPREVEEVIMTHPGVAETAVIGVPDDIWGESVKAFVVTREDLELSPEEIIEYCQQNLAGYKKPKTVDFIKEIPKNLYGKIDRRALKEPFWKDSDRRVH
jgi:acyl-CoA synthetase (AMP-forming)/AMP-acid ligase II